MCVIHVISRKISQKNNYRRFGVNLGGLAVAVPGEMKGLWTAYQMFGGGVPWSDLIMPTVELCEHGIPLSPPLAMNLVRQRRFIKDNPEFK